MKTILLIEDDTALRENTAELLELSGYTVFTAPNGKIGIEKAKSKNPDIIICDIMMPEIDGMVCLKKWLQKKKQSISLLFFFQQKRNIKKYAKEWIWGRMII